MSKSSAFVRVNNVIIFMLVDYVFLVVLVTEFALRSSLICEL
jgi:hypothetical protein